MPEPETDLVAQADRLISAVGTLGLALGTTNDAIIESNKAIAESNNRIADLATYGHHNRYLIRLGVVAGVLVVGLLMVVAYTVRANRQAINRAEDLAAKACAETNEVRAGARVLWEEALNLGGEAGATDMARVNGFRALVGTTYRIRDCAAR